MSKKTKVDKLITDKVMSDYVKHINDSVTTSKDFKSGMDMIIYKTCALILKHGADKLGIKKVPTKNIVFYNKSTIHNIKTSFKKNIDEKEMSYFVSVLQHVFHLIAVKAFDRTLQLEKKRVTFEHLVYVFEHNNNMKLLGKAIGF